MKHQSVLATAVVALLAFTTACGSDEPSTADEVSSLCTDLDALQSSLDGISGSSFDPATTTKDGVEENVTNLQSDVQAVLDGAEGLSESVKTDLNDAFDNFKSALEAIPSDGDQTLAEAGEALVAAGTELRTAWESTVAELNCDTPTTTAAG